MDFNASSGTFNASAIFLDSDDEGENKESSPYFDASPTPNPVVRQKRPDMGARSNSSGALEALIAADPLPKSPGRNGTRRARERQSLRDNTSSWDKLKKRMKSPGRMAGQSPRRVSSPTRESDTDNGESSLVASSDHALISRRRSSGGILATSMAGGARARGFRAMSSHGSRRTSRFDVEASPSQEPARRQRLRVRKKIESIEESDDIVSVAESSVMEASVLSNKSSPRSPKSPRKVKKVKEIDDESASVASERQLKNRLRRKGSKKAGDFSATPNPRSKPMVEMEDFASLTDVGKKVKKKSKRRSSAESAGKKSGSSDDNMSFTNSQDSELPPSLPFGDGEDDDAGTIMSARSERSRSERSVRFDDDAGTVCSARTSGSVKSKKKKKRGSGKPLKSPGKLKRSAKVNVAAFEENITALQEEVLRLKESKMAGESETSKHMQELRRKAFDARLELQKSQLENRQARSDLRDKTTALNEAELDIEALEKKMRDKDSEIERLREQLKNAESDGSSHTPPPPPAPVSTPRKNQAIIDRYENIINRKDTKIANLERELRRLRKSGGGMLSTEQEEMQETIAELQKALKESQAKTIAISKKFSEQRGSTSQLEDEIEHWKSRAYKTGDEVAEVRNELNYWQAKYEDVVGASDAAKAQLAAPHGQLSKAHSIKDLNREMLGTTMTRSASFTSIEDALDDDRPDLPAGGGLWSKLTTPSRMEKPKLTADSLAARRGQFR